MTFLRAAVLVAAAASVALGRAPAETPTRAIVHVDFEDLARGKIESLPEGWIKLEGSGLPHYVNGRLDDSTAAEGRYSFRFDLNGGSLVYRMPAGAIRVVPGALYQIDVATKTKNVEHARPRLTAYFVDIDGRPIVESITHAQPDAPPTNWQMLRLNLEADYPNAHSVVVELGLLQPARLRPGGSTALNVEDIFATAWFDDLHITHVPRVRMDTGVAGNLIRAGDPARLTISLDDQLADDLAAAVTITDTAGRVHFRQDDAVRLTRADARANAVGTVVTPALPPGTYRARLDLTRGGEAVMSKVVGFAVLEQRPGAADARFGLVATDLTARAWKNLALAIGPFRAGRLKLAVWSRRGAVEDAATAGDFDDLLESLRERGVVLTGCLAELPPDIAKAVGGESWTRLLGATPDVWQPQLSFLVARHANHLKHWQLLPDSAAVQFAGDPYLHDVHTIIRKQFESLVGSPDIAVPWPAWFELNDDRLTSISLNVPAVVLPEQIPLYVNTFRGNGRRSVGLALSPIDANSYDFETVQRDLALRFAYALAADVERIDLPLPLIEDDQGLLEPMPLTSVIQTLTSTLAGAIARGNVPVAEGVESMLFELPGGQGVLMLWTKSGSPGFTTLARIAPGGSPRLVTLDGRSVPLSPASPDATQFDVEVGRVPVMIAGVDPKLLRLIASLSLDNPLVESSVDPHPRTLNLFNPFPRAISGSIRLKGPEGWTVSPPFRTFTANPGEAVQMPIAIEIPTNSFAGERLIGVDLLVSAGAEYRVKVPLAVRVGLEQVGLQTIALRDGSDLVVQQIITNYSSKPIDYTAFILCPGVARQERIVSNLSPGSTTIKKYRFPLPAEIPAAIRSGVRQLDGSRILNEEVEIR